ncbi:restriction endonuclease subunit S [Pseudomonas sp.]|uniref:restriction endonuclease subunit S n=1 Tax=Pseudomonas sp. TaxID=306 RepID=UPI003242645B
MTALLTDNLPLLAGAPNGIKKLRELILELAVRGKLVPQDPNDEPASELLKRIAEEKARLVAEGKIKKQKLLAEIGEEEKPFDLPTNWEWVRVAAVGHDWGQTPPDKAFTYIDVGAVDNAAGRISAPQVLMAEDAPSRARKVVRPGTVIYSTIRPYLLNVAVIEEAYEQEPIASTAFAIIHPYLEMPARYFLCYLRSPVFVRYVESVQMGIAYPAINDGQFFSGLIPLPPLAEQHRIVAKVDELMALCDRLEAQQADADSAHAQLVQALLDSLTQASNADDFAQSWQRLAEHFHTLFTTESGIDALKQTLLQLAVMGKLVPQDPRDVPASELINQKASLIAQSVDSNSPLPDGWCRVKGGDVAELVDPHPSHRTPPEVLNGVPYIGYSEISFTTGINFEKARKVGADVFSQHQARYHLKEGDFVFGKIGTIGKPFFLEPPFDYCLSANLILIQPDLDCIAPKYLAFYFDSPAFLAVLDRDKTNSTHAVFGIKKARETSVPLPPLAEQHRIVAKVDQLMALCDQLTARISQAQQLNADLADALIAQSLNEKTPANDHNASPKEARALLGAEILYALDGEQHTGRVKLQKIISLTEHAAKLKEIQSNEQRFAAGPHDPALMRELADELEARHWFAERLRDNGKRYEYQPLSKAGDHRRAYQKLWSDEQRRCVDAILNLVRSWDTARCERVSTLYSAWNDLLIEGKPCSEDNILREVTQRWHDSKRQYTDSVWRSELQSMKQHTVLLPSGFGRRTTGGTLTLPGFE